MPIDDIHFGLDAEHPESIHAMTSGVRMHIPSYIITGTAHEYGLTEIEVRGDLLKHVLGEVIDRVPKATGKTMLDYQADVAMAATFILNRDRLTEALKKIEANENESVA